MSEDGAVWGSSTQCSIPALLASRVADDPDGPYLDFGGVAYTAARMDDESARAAAALLELGVCEGDRVATLIDNSPAAVSLWLASLKVGAITVPINTANRRDFLRRPLVDSGARVVLVGQRYVERLAEVLPGVPDLAAAIVHDAGSEPTGSLRSLQVRRWDEMLDLRPASTDPGDVAPGALATLIATAGTTGPSKLCMLSHNYIVNACRRTGAMWGRRDDDILWTPLPLFHLAPYMHAVVGALACGGSASIDTKFSVSRFWPEMHRTGATMAALLGSMTALLAAAEGDDVRTRARSSLRLVVAAPTTEQIDATWRARFGVEIFSAGYAVTEGGPLSIISIDEENKPRAAGLASTADFDTRIFDDDDREVAPGVVGEIVTRPRGPKVMFDGYWGRPEDTARVMRNLWFHTGDLGRVDEDGYLYFVDRKKDYLRRRGENISSFEVEAVFRGHDAVLDVAAHAAPSEIGEDEVKVTLVLRPGVTLTEEALCRWAIERLPYFAVPRYIEFRDELPRNPVGRVLKYVLRDEGVTLSTWDREAAGVTFERY